MTLTQRDPATGAAPTTTSPAPAPGVLPLLIAVLAVTIPLAHVQVLWSSPGGEADWTRSVLVAPFDVVLAVLVVLSARAAGAWRDLFASRLVRAGSVLFALGFAVALLAHPSWLGVALGLRLGAGLAVLAATTQALDEASGRRLVLGCIAAVGVAQAALAMAQSARGTSFGITPLDFAGPLYPFGTSSAGRGGLPHPYHLAVLLVVAQGAALLGLREATRRWPWLVALGVIGAGTAVTYTRSGLIGQVALVVVALGARRAGPTRLAAAAVVGGLLLGGVAFGDGWVARAETTTSAEANPTSSRTDRLREAGELIRAEPVTGVGPGRYVTALAEGDAPELLPAHNLLAHELAELGPLGALGTLVLSLALARTVWRGGAWTAMVALPMTGFLLLDAYPYVFPTGLALSALWLAFVRWSATPRRAA